MSLIALGVFFPVYLNLLSGIQSMDRKLLEVGWVHGCRGVKLIWHFFLPAALPSFFGRPLTKLGCAEGCLPLPANGGRKRARHAHLTKSGKGFIQR
ncbi:ABC transporter permease subunit [Paenibacillus thermoaerophilus]|uniref:ABC transporter permease subunit n=1 Tax=Paenibacillus thermoaerophilus TaxID=1215385 RepID=UPI002482A306|nr:ABC transporter permease subunit [Paenibacillus thermoaerophilus]